MRRFYLHRRNGIYYAQLVDPATGRAVTARSTGTRNRDDALLVVADWLKNGVPAGRLRRLRPVSATFTVAEILDGVRSSELTDEDVGKLVALLIQRRLLVSAVLPDDPGAEPLSKFLRRFWSHDGPYASEKRAHGQRLGHTHIGQSRERAEKYWIPYFSDKPLGEITRSTLKAFALHLSDPELHLAANTKNRIMVVGTTALKWAHNNDLISTDPTSGITTFSGAPRKRGVLEPEEAAALFQLAWPDVRVKIGNLLAATTGLRLGEILALKAANIEDTYVAVRQSYSEREGLKSTKTGTERRVPLLPSVRDALLEVAETNPFGPDGFIFWGEKPTVPMNARAFVNGLREMLVRLTTGHDGDDEDRERARLEWEKRNVIFHSWRHFYAARMADRLDARKVMRATGHRTARVFDVYADHQLEIELTEVGNVAGEVFGRIVPFKTKASNQ